MGGVPISCSLNWPDHRCEESQKGNYGQKQLLGRTDRIFFCTVLVLVLIAKFTGAPLPPASAGGPVCVRSSQRAASASFRQLPGPAVRGSPGTAVPRAGAKSLCRCNLSDVLDPMYYTASLSLARGDLGPSACPSLWSFLYDRPGRISWKFLA